MHNRTHHAFGLALAWTMTQAVPAGAATLHVPADYPTIQSCIDAAASGEDECVVDPGTYNERIDFLGKTITVRSSDGPEVTILDGFGLVGAVVTCIRGESFGTVLDGFTIMRGTAGQFAGEYGGGGMLNFRSSPAVTNCVFRQNSGNIGAAMFNYSGSNPRIANCRFLENNAHLGGAIINYVSSSPEITNCTFEGNNAADGVGGAIENFVQCQAVINGCTFRRNSAYRGGAIYNDWMSPTKFTDCTFEENTATHGGAIYDELHSPSSLDRCVFVRNRALMDGGAIGNEHDSQETITSCQFIENEAVGFGGALATGDFSFSGELIITQSIFEGNKALQGGALHLNSGNASLSNCDFEGNQAAGDGGAIYYEDEKVRITASCFARNSATNGGAIANLGGQANFTECRFEKNTAANWGGAMYDSYSIVNYYGTSRLTDCIFLGNTAREGGGYYLASSEAKLDRCDFIQNTAQNAGAMVLVGSENEVSQCRFEANSASAYGGAIWLFSFSDPTVISDCEFKANNAMGGGAIYNVSGDAPEIRKSTFLVNSAGIGGGILHDGDGLVDNCRFVGNRAGNGGAMFVLYPGTMTTDSLFVGNTAQDGAVIAIAKNTSLSRCTMVANEATQLGYVVTGWDTSVDLSECVLAENNPGPFAKEWFTATIAFSNVSEGVPPHCTDAGGNIDADPQFVRSPSHGGDGWGDNPETAEIDESFNDDFGDLRLQPGSPCINTGDSGFVPVPGETDLDGHSRVLCSRVDMGAYEFGIGDYDCNQAVNLADLAGWASCMTDAAARGCESFDFNADGTVDLHDFAAWQRTLAN